MLDQKFDIRDIQFFVILFLINIFWPFFRFEGYLWSLVTLSPLKTGIVAVIPMQTGTPPLLFPVNEFFFRNIHG